MEKGLSDEGSLLSYGETPAFTGTTPAKNATAQYTYAFSGWIPELVKVTGDETYTAAFTANAKPASYYLKSLTGDGLGGDIVAVFGRTIDDARRSLLRKSAKRKTHKE